ncbi:ABC transporter ATP-binding protein/permease [Actinomyces sp. B33]|uniref:ABC transporter ATP-binding protein/permease n=1 Tax=Actinomyces sp. B33 TaxID=2942131 RepID=UPI0023410796|nr:ABC transporter ATP-binding protein [Actinomyces sp. B33]MDC4232753.1 ABC transporter ATP-binding protein/permease [Actinomyces sp. B33]
MTRALVVALAWLTALALGTAYLLIGRGVDAVLAGATWDHWPLALGAALLSGAASGAVAVLTSRDAARLEPHLRGATIRQVFALGPTERTAERAGRIVNTATDGVERAAAYKGAFIAPMIASLTTPVLVVLLIGATLDWTAAGFLAISIPVVPLSVGGFQKAFRPVSRRYRSASRALAAQELDAIQGLGALALMNAGRPMGRRLARASEDVRSTVMRYLAGNQLVLLVIDSVFSLGMITGAAALALIRVDAGALSVGEGLALVLLSSIMLDPLDRIGQFFYIGMGGIAADKEIRRFASQTPLVADPPGAAAPDEPPAPGRIDIDGVSFAYDPAAPVLVGATARIDPGEHVVLTGASGAGKSTLSSLLQAHRRPDSGRLSIDGVDLARAPLDWIRSRTGVVEQATYLFSGTLRDNLLIADPAADDARLIDALTRARLADLLARLPDGLDTRVGSRGLALSGGEAQRVAIARALLKDAPILLLDEPTAHVDLASERDILDALADAGRGRTVLTISHRTATIADADRRIDLTEGALR